MDKVKLITTDSYFNLFNLLKDELKGKTIGLEENNIVFCEEKISLMVERVICNAFKGSFNTNVFSFGNFLHKLKTIPNVLSKEGSSMAIKRILSQTELKCFSSSKTNLAPTLYDLILQLKSAKVNPNDIFNSLEQTPLALKNKLIDIATVYQKYEDFLKEKGLDDQSNTLTSLPQLILDGDFLEGKNVILLGYTSWTKQARDIILAIFKKAKSVTAILTAGENSFLYLNETANYFKSLVKESNLKLEELFVKSPLNKEASVISRKLFNPLEEKVKSDNIYYFTQNNAYSEVETVAESIKAKVMSGEFRYSDFSIAVSNINQYKDIIKKIFTKLDIPFFADVKCRPENHPEINLIKSYFDCFIKNFEREKLSLFYKNPLISGDKRFLDEFYVYTLKYNINYKAIFRPFTLGFSDQETKEKFENFRQRICKYLEKFDIKNLLNDLAVKEKIDSFTEKLKDLNENEESEINGQVYDAVDKILCDMEFLLDGVKLSLIERKQVFLSGISALELSVIPQYQDAVFCGGYKEIALAQSKFLFFLGLTDSVPSVREDVALLNDSDLSILSNLKVLVEPKIKVVNDRVKENLGMALISFSQKLFLSKPNVDFSGKQVAKSRVIDFFNNTFTLKPYSYKNGFLTKKQGINNFAKSCRDFAEYKLNDISSYVSYYKVNKGEGTVTDILNCANSEIKVKLNIENKTLLDNVCSPTLIEDFYKCPYRAFATRVLRLKSQDDGSVSALSVGNVMHEIFHGVLKCMDKDFTIDEFNITFDKVKQEVLSNPDYKRFLDDATTSVSLERALLECKKFCYKNLVLLENSLFKPTYFEQDFKIDILGGKIKLKGKIDRVDTYKNYFRVIDYKTGNVDDKENLLFSGTKLQLYLYALNFKDKVPAGVYYARVNDEYTSIDKKEPTLVLGKTIDDIDVLKMQDINIVEKGNSEFLPVTVDGDKLKKTISKKALSCFIAYAQKMCEKAVEQIQDGVIVSSPFLDACKYCELSGLCQGERLNGRKILGVDSNVIEQAVTEGEKGNE